MHVVSGLRRRAMCDATQGAGARVPPGSTQRPGGPHGTTRSQLAPLAMTACVRLPRNGASWTPESGVAPYFTRIVFGGQDATRNDLGRQARNGIDLGGQYTQKKDLGGQSATRNVFGSGTS